MAIQIANPGVVEKIEKLATLTGLNKTAAVEVAVDRLLEEARADTKRSRQGDRWEALLTQLHRIEDRPDAYDPLEWDEHGLPK